MEEPVQNKNHLRVLFSMLTASSFGAVIAFMIIIGGQYVFSKVSDIAAGANTALSLATTTKTAATDYINTSLLEEADQDPSFISRFSRVHIYSADSGKEFIESVKSTLPHISTVKVSASAYAVIDLDRDAIVLEKNPEKLLPIASISKLVTAVVAKKLLKETTSVTINKTILDTYGNEAWFRIGEKFTVGELFYPLLMVSSNDASEALARAYPAGRKEFIKEMNAWVNSIGAYRTIFTDPSGLSSKNISTVKDLSIIVKWIMKNEPELFDITLLKSKTIRTHTWTNPTHFLNITSYVGGKNGYTPEANRTSIALFKLGLQKRLYGIILLGSADRDDDILNLLEEALK